MSIPVVPNCTTVPMRIGIPTSRLPRKSYGPWRGAQEVVVGIWFRWKPVTRRTLGRRSCRSYRASREHGVLVAL